ncbi:Sphingolipid C4-hydroxylase sur2 [Knufia peltigerae]|nr:Sphingolipid C4-hydroxylase sur2 [Knufia peltigerae]
MANSTLQDLPPLPSYTLASRPSMIPGVPDIVCQLLAPVIAYWVVSGFFHILDVFDVCAKYRLHTPAEVLKRNHVTRWEVFRDVVLQQIIQTVFGLAVAYFDPEETVGREEFDVTLWAYRLRHVQQYVPSLLAIIGLDAQAMGGKLQNYPQLAAALCGGTYGPQAFAPWEMSTAKFIYWIGIPGVQFTVAILIVDTWQYFLHRAMHMNKFLYTTLHSRHHRLYVPYAYGALYNHPIEGFMLDTLGTGIAYLVTGMTIRQGMWFFTCSTIKTVDDHCGYAFPWDPLQHITSNNAAYHDVHHQSWGIKTNFSQPFFTFWDRILNTAWTGGDVSARYQRDRIAAQRKVDADLASSQASVVNSPEIDMENAQQQTRSSQKQVLENQDGARVIAEEAREEQEVKQSLRRSTRRKSGFDAKAFSDRMAGTLHGRSPAILHAD